MVEQLDRRAAATMEATIRWRITDRPDGERADVYELTVKDGHARVRRGEVGTEPNVTITLAAAERVRIATGGSDPMQSYFKGRIKLAGDIMVAAGLRSIFRIPTASR